MMNFKEKKMAEPESPLFKNNMALLHQHHPNLAGLVSEKPKTKGASQVVLAVNGKANIQVKSPDGQQILIHEPSDPGREAASFLSLVPEDSTGVVLMFGMGLGYSVLELAKKRKKLQAIVVFELNPDFFIHGLGQLDFSDLLCDKRVCLSVGELGDIAPVLGPIQSKLMLENIHTLNLTTCFKINSAYAELSSVVFDYVNALNAEGNTKTLYGEAFVKNRLQHLTSIAHDRKLEDLAGAFKGRPAIIVAAGPSLDKNIGKIARAQKNAVVISADTALPTLLAKDIVPDFVTAIDYKELTYEKIAVAASDPRCRETSLICTSWVTHKVTKVFPAKSVFWAFSPNALEKWMNRLLGGSVFIPGAGTVAHLNFISASVMGCDPIIFVGQDLAFTGEKGHASNVILSSRNHTKELLEAPEGVMSVKGWHGDRVKTNRQMHGYLRGFEKMIEGVRADVINATEGGAFIEGAVHMPLVEAISKFCIQPIDVTLPLSRQNPEVIRAVERTLKEGAGLEKNIKKADKLGAFVVTRLSKMEKKRLRPKSLSELPEGLQKKILDLDGCHQKADDNSLWEIFNEMTMDGVRQNEREKHDIQALEGNPEKYLEWLNKSIVRVNKVNRIRMKNLLWFKQELGTLRDFLKKEKSAIDPATFDKKRAEKLGGLYLETDNYVLLERFLNDHGDALSKGALAYYRGGIALSRSEFEKADELFESAVHADKSFENIIAAERSKRAEAYLDIALAQSTSAFQSHGITMMLLEKGLSSCPGHAKIESEISRRFEATLSEAKKNNESPGQKKMTGSIMAQIGEWVDTLENSDIVSGLLEKKSLMELYQAQGILFTRAKDYQKALAAYERALVSGGDNPAIFISMADICFTQEDFDLGIQYLKVAVKLDKQCAVYWFNMGKNLQSQKDYEGAILAFEQYFIALPDNVIALKEMGVCYRKLGNLEAAEEAYRQFSLHSDKDLE